MVIVIIIATFVFIWYLNNDSWSQREKRDRDVLNDIVNDDWAKRSREIRGKVNRIKEKYPQGLKKYESNYYNTFKIYPSDDIIINYESTISAFQSEFDMKEKPELIKKAENLRSKYPLGYKYYVCRDLSAPIDLEFALKASKNESLIISKHREISHSDSFSDNKYSSNKYKGISFLVKMKSAKNDLFVYKILSRKRYKKDALGELRSFESPDEFMSYKLGETTKLKLSLNEFVPDYELSPQLDKGHEKLVGIISYKEKPSYESGKYETAIYECVIPSGSYYYEGYMNNKIVAYLSDRIVVKKKIQ